MARSSEYRRGSQDQLWVPNPADGTDAMPALTSLEEDEAARWVERVKSVRRYTKKGKGEIPSQKRAPYKPLLLLWLIGRVAKGEASQVSFKDAEEDLTDLMRPHSMRKSGVRVQYPFLHLAADRDLWRVEDSTGRDVSKLPDEESRRMGFLRGEVVGRLAPDFERALKNDHVRSRVVRALLEMEFPETQHEPILEQTNLAHVVATEQAVRDPNFKRIVLHAYEGRCCFCGYDLRLAGAPVGLDAAHVQMRAKGGPDKIENGVALCVQHHRLFDSGALGLDRQHRILVSESLHLSDQDSANDIRRLVNIQIRLPLRRYQPPARAHLDWHRKNLFKEPARL